MVAKSLLVFFGSMFCAALAAAAPDETLDNDGTWTARIDGDARSARQGRVVIVEFAGHWQEIGRPARWGPLPRRQALSNHGAEEHQQRGRVHRLGRDGQRRLSRLCPHATCDRRAHARRHDLRWPRSPPDARTREAQPTALTAAGRGPRGPRRRRPAARTFTLSPRRRCTSKRTRTAVSSAARRALHVAVPHPAWRVFLQSDPFLIRRSGMPESLPF